MKRIQFVGDTENAINNYFKKLVMKSNWKYKLSKIDKLDWWYPETNFRGQKDKLYRILVTLKSGKKIKFRSMDEFNKYFDTYFESYGSFDLMKKVIEKLNPKAKIYQSEFDCS